MTPQAGAFFASGILVMSVSLHLFFYRLGRRHGRTDGSKQFYQAGYERGRQAADNWWIGVEAEIVRQREKMWLQ